jgi:hypothetical protein
LRAASATTHRFIVSDSQLLCGTGWTGDGRKRADYHQDENFSLVVVAESACGNKSSDLGFFAPRVEFYFLDCRRGEHQLHDKKAAVSKHSSDGLFSNLPPDEICPCAALWFPILAPEKGARMGYGVLFLTRGLFTWWIAA